MTFSLKKLRSTTVCLLGLGWAGFFLLAGCQSPAASPKQQPFLQASAGSSAGTEPIAESGYEAYEKIFSANYKKGQKLARQILRELEESGVEKKVAVFAVAVVFPELTRHDPVNDFFAKMANSATVNSKSQKNYSVGEMQMTPLFAVDVERQVALYADLQKKYVGINFAGDTSTAQARKKRLERIGSRKFQMKYLLAFVEVFARLYAGEIEGWLDEGEASLHESGSCLAYFATAYNAGFLRPLEELGQFMLRFGFPYGGLDPRSHWNYRSIAQGWFAAEAR